MFNRFKADALLSHREYNYKLKFIEKADKAKLSRSRIYFISGQKLKKVKKYLNEYLKKRFIVLNYTLFAFFILFAKKLNKDLRFYINYRKLNQITKRNRYLILLIDEVLVRIQGYKYLTRLNIIAVFNKLRIYSNSEDFITFIIFLDIYKYRVLLFGLTNRSTNF